MHTTIQAASGKAEEESDTGVVSATTTTPTNVMHQRQSRL